jgi:hypothetical protein
MPVYIAFSGPLPGDGARWGTQLKLAHEVGNYPPKPGDFSIELKYDTPALQRGGAVVYPQLSVRSFEFYIVGEKHGINQQLH